MNKETNEVLKSWRQSKDALRNDVVQCFKTDYKFIKSTTIHLETLFRSKGIKNETTKRIDDCLKYFSSWETYYDILRYEITSHREARKQYLNELQKLREEIIILKQEASMREYDNKT